MYIKDTPILSRKLLKPKAEKIIHHVIWIEVEDLYNIAICPYRCS